MESTSQLGASTSLPQLNKGPQLISGSGSFQSYLSSAGSYHRHAKGAGVHLDNHTSVHTDNLQGSITLPSKHSRGFFPFRIVVWCCAIYHQLPWIPARGPTLLPLWTPRKAVDLVVSVLLLERYLPLFRNA
jgi:hypothetical protein